MGNSVFATAFKRSSSVFGELALYTHDEGGESYEVKGIFTRTPVEIEDGGGSIGVASVRHTFSVLLADFKKPPKSCDEIQIRMERYRVIEVQEASSGTNAKLVLMRAKEAENASL